MSTETLRFDATDDHLRSCRDPRRPVSRTRAAVSILDLFGQASLDAMGASDKLGSIDDTLRADLAAVGRDLWAALGRLDGR